LLDIKNAEVFTLPSA